MLCISFYSPLRACCSVSFTAYKSFLESKKEILFKLFQEHQSTQHYKLNASKGQPTPLVIADIREKTKWDRTTIHALITLFKSEFTEIGNKGGWILNE